MMLAGASSLFTISRSHSELDISAATGSVCRFPFQEKGLRTKSAAVTNDDDHSKKGGLWRECEMQLDEEGRMKWFIAEPCLKAFHPDDDDDNTSSYITRLVC